MEDERIWQGFIRQRRNLIIVSLVLLLVHTEELSFVKLSLFGNVSELKSHTTILFILWIGWIYWVIRYYQYYVDLGRKGIESSFNSIYRTYVSAAVEKKAPKSEAWHQRANELGIDPNAEITASNSDPIGGLRTKYEGKVRINYRNSDGTNAHQFVYPRINVFPTLIAPIIKSTIHVSIHTHLITEYVLPFVIAILPLVYVTLWKPAVSPFITKLFQG